MTYYPEILTDSGILGAYYSAGDPYNQQVQTFFEQCRRKLITTLSCITQVMWLPSSDWRVQNEFLHDLAIELYECIPLEPQDYIRIAELNEQYASLPGDFADLSLVAISERLKISAIASLDSDFDVYRRYRNDPFVRVFRPQ